MKFAIRLGSFLLLVGLFGLGMNALAQSDDIYTGTLTERETISYEIDISSGDGIIVTAMADQDSTLDPIVSLSAADGRIILQNDDYTADSLDARLSYIAEEDRTISVILSSYGVSSGAYILQIEYINQSDIIRLGTSSDELGDPDLEFAGFVSDEQQDEYIITLEAGEAVLIDAMASDGSILDSYLTLLNEDGDEVAVNDDAIPGETLDSQIVYIAEESGEYTIVMGNYPGSEGDYDLFVTFITAEVAESLQVVSVPEAINTTPTRDPDFTFTGENDDQQEIDYEIELAAEQGVVAAVYGFDGMDTTLSVIDPNGVEILFNDDRGDTGTLDSQVAFSTEMSGTYHFVVSNYPGSPGEFRLDVYLSTEEEVEQAQQAMRVLLSGALERLETEHFVIHYTQEGADAVELDYVEAVAETVEEVYQIQIVELGWREPPTDGRQGGDNRYDVYLVDLGSSLYGYMSSSSPLGDHPATDIVEEFAQAGYLVLDNDYIWHEDPIRAMRTTTAHEFHHIIQYGYDSTDNVWYYESTASWMETVTFPDDEEATIYVDDVFRYPEACFGGEGGADPSGLGVYGTWLFMDFINVQLGADAPLRLWENLIQDDHFDPLEDLLADYDETVPGIVSQYHINNLMRDYAMIDNFDDQTVWLEQTIDEIDDWQPEGQGIQELGANYYEVDLDEGIYEFVLDDSRDLTLFAIGIDGDDGDVYALGDGGTVDTEGYDYVYLMVFNLDYDDSLETCRYTDYTIEVATGASDDRAEVSYQVDASHFAPLNN